jgi:alpha-galactosidase
MPLKIAMIGAGSIGFTRRLMSDVLAVPEFADTTFAFTDINERNLSMVTQLAERDIAANQLPTRIQSTLDRRAAIADSDYVICMIRQGGLKAFQHDIDIPLKYGVDQCVGDTLSAGGLMYAQRTIPALLDFCRDIREVAKPGALFINYANPMAMNTWACNKYGGVKTIGLCHGVQGAHWQITRAVEEWARREGLLAPDAKLHRREVDVVFAGINHQTWCVQASWRGQDLIPRLHALLSAVDDFGRTEKVRLDVLKRFGYYSTESNGHLSEYLPWYRKRTDEIAQWIDTSSWIHGETGGYLRVITEARNWFEHEFPTWVKETPPTSARTTAARSTARTLSRPSKPAGPTAGTSTSSTRGTSPTCPTAASSRSPATWTAPASTCRWWVRCPWPAPPPAPPACACRRWPWKPPSTATSPCSSRPCFTTRWWAPSAIPKKSGR